MVQAFEVTPWSALLAGVVLDDLLDALVARPSWYADALCREYPDVTFFPERGESAEPARDVCRHCLVRPECLATAVEAGTDLHGVLGATSGRDRRTARRLHLNADDLL